MDKEPKIAKDHPMGGATIDLPPGIETPAPDPKPEPTVPAPKPKT